jgi:3-phosphoshikimate 1-carboxyvinyltransferase
MNIVVNPSALNSGAVSVPGDKSISHRALMLGAVADGTTTISGFLAGEDCRATLGALRAMGVKIDELSATDLSVSGAGLYGLQRPSGPLDMGNSGTAMRLFAGLLCGQSFSSRLIGDESLSNRPMNRVIQPLSMMGARISAEGGKPPLHIDGGQKLTGLVYRLPVASAQVKSAILLAGLYADGEVTVIEPAVTRDHTERMLRSMGVALTQGETQIILNGGQNLKGTNIEVPADLSSAAFVILAAIISADAEVTIERVGVNPTRTGVIDILKEMGADISVDNVQLFGEEPVADITVRSSRLFGIDVHPAKVSLAIDEFPVLFVAAAAMAEGLRALSVPVDETQDGAVVHGGKLYGGVVRSHGDHRIAMSFAVAGTVAEWPVHIEDTDAVATSFPGFVDCLRSLGVDITCQDGSGES